MANFIVKAQRKGSKVPLDQSGGWAAAQFEVAADPTGNRSQRRKWKKRVGKR